MKTNSIYTIENEIKATKIKSSINFDEVKKFIFNKLTNNRFDRTVLVDYKVIDEVNGDSFPLSQIEF